MAAKPISQKEALRLRKRVKQLEDLLQGERRRYSSDWPGGVHVASTFNASESVRTAIGTARVLGHAVVVTVEGGTLKFFALPHPKVPV